MSAPTYVAIIEEVLEVEREEAERGGDEMSSKPRPPASAEAIAKAEEARGRTFSDAYRAFLGTCDGWEYFAWGISLFGTEELAGEAYEDALETLSYSEDRPAEVDASLIIGKNENDATMILLTVSGEVIDHLYEETRRYPDLASYLRSRKDTLLEMRAGAREAIARTEREWEPAFREADDAALASSLRTALAHREAVPEAPDPAELAVDGASPTPEPTSLVARRGKKGKLGATLELGLVLYLGAAPSKDEVLETFRAFRRAFPFDGPLTWSLADRMVFSMERSEDPDAEPFADRLRVDDTGFFGLRVVREVGKGASYILNVRGIPPEESYDEDEGDDGDDGEDDGDEREATPTLTRRASFVEVLVPAAEDPEKLRALCHALVDILPVRSGHGGWFARVHDDEIEPNPWDTVFSWCRRYFAVEPCYVDGWLTGALTHHRGAGWLTVLGRPFVEALSDFTLSDGVVRYDGKYGAVLTAGALTLGDVQRGDFPVRIAEVARLLAPVSLTTWARRGEISMGGVWFSTFADQLPGAFNHHHATESFMRRFVDPRRFLGPSAREKGLAFLERLRASMDAATRKKWQSASDLRDIEHFKDLNRALSSGAFFTPDAALRLEVLEHLARYPGWTPPEAFNNLLHAYYVSDRMGDALALLPVALRVAHDQNNPHTYHNAACLYVLAGKLDEAMDCVQRAKDEGYPLMDRLVADEDLSPLHDRADWKALFAGG